MIKLEQIDFSYKTKRVLDIDSLMIEDGQKIALMGLNGAGKTTLAELIMGIKSGYKGKIIRDKKYRYNAVFQDQSFVSDVNLKDIFYLYCSLYGVKKNHAEYFNIYDLNNLEKNVYKKISGGQQQKFKFMIALLNDPNFLLLDEISTGLDYVWRIKIIELIKTELAKQVDKTLLLISHNPEEIAELCERVIVLENGKIVKDFQLTGDLEEKKKLLDGMVRLHV